MTDGKEAGGGIGETGVYTAARLAFDVSASEVKRELGTDVLRRLDPEGTSDTKLIELVMEAMMRIVMRDGREPRWPRRNND